MSEHPTWVVGNRNPSISETITDEDGAPVDLTGATVAFKAREVGSSTLKTNAAISSTPDATGFVRYDWAAVDVDTAADYLVWWTVTIAGKTQDVGEALIYRVEHAPASGYVELEEIRSSLEIRETTHADKDLVLAIEAASAVVDMLTGQTFALEAAATRKFTPIAEDFVAIDQVSAITALTVNDTAWTEDTDYFVDDQAVLRTLNGRRFHRSNQSVVITGDFGYADVPAEIKAATTIIAAQIMKRAREATFGVLALTLDGSAVRIGRTDPQVDLLLAKWRRVMVS